MIYSPCFLTQIEVLLCVFYRGRDTFVLLIESRLVNPLKVGHHGFR